MIRVREYAVLTCDKQQTPSMDVGIVSSATIDWLMELQKSWRNKENILESHNRTSIKLGSYVGFLQSPTGESIEILPKSNQHAPTNIDITDNRILLRKMLAVSQRLKPRETGPASLQRLKGPLHEWIISEYLSELSKLVRRGLRFNYQRIEEESSYISGQLDIAKQSRQMPDRATYFHIRHDIYTSNRIENRLLRTALDFVLKITKHADNWRLANELKHQMIEIKPLLKPANKLSKWQDNKLMQSYGPVKPWCQLIIEKLNPSFQKGEHRGIALIYPMEYLFENYVAHCLHKSLDSGSKLQTQASSKYLLKHASHPEFDQKNWFKLKPDLLLISHNGRSAMDTKWKLLDSSLTTGKDKYGISQSDMYQLYAYGKKYMHGEGHMMLIYPSHTEFNQPLPVFSFDEKLHLWVVPFDLHNKQLIDGDWVSDFPSVSPISQDILKIA